MSDEEDNEVEEATDADEENNEVEEAIDTDEEENEVEETTEDDPDDASSNRMQDSCCGMLVGVFLVFASIALLGWNENRAVKRYTTLKQADKAVLSISSDSVIESNEGKLVHFSGMAQNVNENITDPLFGVVASDVLRFRREVQVYQWEERRTNKKDTNNKKTTEYSYAKVWSNNLIDSRAFKRPKGHENSPIFSYQPNTVNGQVKVGAFSMGDDVLSSIDWFEPFSTNFLVDNINQEALDANPKQNVRVTEINSGFYFGGSPTNPMVDDTKVTFKGVPGQVFSILAAQSGDSFTKYITKNKGEVFVLSRGTISAEGMIQDEVDSNSFVTWILRFVGFAVMGISFAMILEPLSVMLECIPCVGPWLGDVVGGAMNLVAFLLAVMLNFIVVAVAWIAVRPIVAGGIFVGVAGIMSFLNMRKRKKKKEYNDEEQELSGGDN